MADYLEDRERSNIPEVVRKHPWWRWRTSLRCCEDPNDIPICTQGSVIRAQARMEPGDGGVVGAPGNILFLRCDTVRGSRHE